jgi:thiamine kinase-like enzyme
MRIRKQALVQICKKLYENFLSYSFLGSGNHNVNFRIDTSRKKYVLRIENNPQFKNLRKEYRLLRKIDPDLGPKVYFIDMTHNIIPTDYLVEEYIEGETLSKPDDKFLILFARWLRKLHNHKITSERYSLVKAVKPYIKNVEKNKNVIPKKQSHEIDILIKKVLEFCKKNDVVFANRKTFSLLHGDLSKENIFYNGKEIRLIDWEFSRYGFPEWDLVYLMQSLRLNDKQKELFLKIYKFPKKNRKNLLIISLLNSCGDIGYSVWRLELIRRRKLRANRATIRKRLQQDMITTKKILFALCKDEKIKAGT